MVVDGLAADHELSAIWSLLCPSAISLTPGAHAGSTGPPARPRRGGPGRGTRGSASSTALGTGTTRPRIAARQASTRSRLAADLARSPRLRPAAPRRSTARCRGRRGSGPAARPRRRSWAVACSPVSFGIETSRIARSTPGERQLDRLDPVGRLRHDLDVGLPVEHRPQAAADDLVVVGEQHPGLQRRRHRAYSPGTARARSRSRGGRGPISSCAPITIARSRMPRSPRSLTPRADRGRCLGPRGRRVSGSARSDDRLACGARDAAHSSAPPGRSGR